jgi:SRSO17 transposase
LHRYCTGLLLPGERKSIEPMAARLDPLQVQATHQSLHHFIAKAPWSDAAVLAAVREQVLPALTRHGPITAWILDDTGFPKKEKPSVGVARQYCGQLGKQDNCQVAVSLSLANDESSLPVAFDLYLPQEWADDPVRRAKAGVPKSLAFRTKPQIALEQIRRALADGLPPGVVLGDAAYGVDTDFRTALTASSVSYVLGVPSTLGVWPPGCGPLPPKPGSGKGRRPTLQRRDDAHQPVSAKDLALTLPASAWQTVSWRAGSQGELSGRFAAVRVRSSHRDYWRSEPHAEEWLLIEWPEGDKEPSRYWLSTLPAPTALVDLVHMAKLR